MSDLETIKTLFSARGIEFREEHSENPENQNHHIALLFCEGDKGVEGYNGFYTAICFTPAGVLISIGAWE